ncbi:hypothetical protein LEMLEM_LOCUS14412, partial [Lemmus lemmus]
MRQEIDWGSITDTWSTPPFSQTPRVIVLTHFPTLKQQGRKGPLIFILLPITDAVRRIT